MQFSEYSQDFRFRVVKEALKKYDGKKAERRQGEVTIEDDRNAQTKKRERVKGHRWYMKEGRYESIMYVQPTEGARLQREVQRLAKKHNIRMKVVEKVGPSIKGMLQRSNPFSKRICGRDKCILCQNGSNVDCRERGCVYSMMCKVCKRKYRGQTGRSMNERMNEQFAYWERGVENNPLTRHSELYHNGEKFDVEVKVEARCYGKPSRRYITEAVMIEELREDETMNNKNEWSYVKLKKVQVT